MAPQLNTVEVSTGQVSKSDITLRDFDAPTGESGAGVVRLSKFVVGSTREMDGAARAINEQRFAANIKNVASSDEFGGVSEGNVGEVLKFFPGVRLETSGGNMRYVSIQGVSEENVPVTVDNFSLASAQALTGRAVPFDMVSINSLSRIEVSYSPTPDSQAAALAGSVNMVSRSAFERSKPSLTTSVYMMMRDNDTRFQDVPGPRSHPNKVVHTGFDFTYTVPVSKRFGFTLSAGHSSQYSDQDISTNTWRGAGAATNGTRFCIPRQTGLI